MQADGAFHSRTIEMRMATAKKAKARLRTRMGPLSHGSLFRGEHKRMPRRVDARLLAVTWKAFRCFFRPPAGLDSSPLSTSALERGCILSPLAAVIPVADFTFDCQKTLGVITPTAGTRSRAIRVCCLYPGFRMSLAVPHSHGEVAGVASFLGLRVAASGPYVRQIA